MMTFNCVIHFNPVIEIFQGEITRLDKSFKEKLNSIILIRNFIQQRMHELKFFAKMREFQFLCNSSLRLVSITLHLHLTCFHSFLSTHTLSLATLVLTPSQSRKPSFKSHTLGGYCLIQIAYSHNGYDLRSLLIQIAHSLHKRLVSHLHYLGLLLYFINLRFVLCSRYCVIWI